MIWRGGFLSCHPPLFALLHLVLVDHGHSLWPHSSRVQSPRLHLGLATEEKWVWEEEFAKSELDTATIHQGLGLSLHFRDRGGGVWRGLLGRCLGYQRNGR